MSDDIEALLEKMGNGFKPTFKDDDTEPVYVCKSASSASVLYQTLIQPRYEKGDLSYWVAHNSVLFMDDETCRWLIDVRLDESETAELARKVIWRPVVLTFQNSQMVAKLSSLGIPVATMHTEFPEIEQVRRAIRSVVRKADEWPDALTEDAFYGIVGEFVRLVEPETEADPAALLFNFLIAAGVLFGREAYVVADGRKHYANEYLLMVGSTGTGRKGTATGRVIPVMEQVEEKFKDLILGGLSSGEGLIKGMSPEEDETFEPTQEVEDPNAETGAPKTTDEKVRRYLALIPEFASLLGVQKREGNTLSATLREAWDSGRLRVLTRKEPLDVDNVNLSVIGHVTQGELLKSMSETEKINGFANRFLAICVRRSKLLPEGGKSVDFSLIIQQLRDVVDAAKGRGEIHRDEDTKKLWAVEYQRLTAERAGIRGALLSRAEAHVLRLSMLYALLDGSAEIHRQHLKAALAVWEYCDQSVGYVYHGISDDEDGDKILAALSEGALTSDEIRRTVFQRNKPADWVEAKLTHMEREGRIVQTTKEGERKKELAAWKKP